MPPSALPRGASVVLFSRLIAVARLRAAAGYKHHRRGRSRKMRTTLHSNAIPAGPQAEQRSPPEPGGQRRAGQEPPRGSRMTRAGGLQCDEVGAASDWGFGGFGRPTRRLRSSWELVQ